MISAQKKKTSKLTTDDLIKLLCDIAYEQATREVSGTEWFNNFIAKIDQKEKLK